MRDTLGNRDALESASVLRDQGVKDLPELVEAETMLYFILEEGFAGVMVIGFKKGMGRTYDRGSQVGYRRGRSPSYHKLW
jgi:hypothetical protein